VTCPCGGFGAAAERQFTEQIAARDLESYLTKGPGRTTRLLRDGLLRAGPVDGVLLDIGAGIGALTFELLEAGVTRAIDVDASRAYIATASREAVRRNCLETIQFIRDDFLGAAAQIPSAAIVTLDRVICCYPASRPLLEEAVKHAERLFAFSYPRDTWYVRVWNAMLNGKRHLTGNPFRTYIHSAAEMERVVADAGFRCVSRRGTFAWSVDVYVRSTSESK
jgi:magnesium-protoporphyrin O-methyltransferase